MRRGTLAKADRIGLERLALWLGLSFESKWSNKHLANLIYWRITRNGNNRH